MLTYPEWKKQYVDRTKQKKSDIIILPNADNVVIPEAKFTKYALDPERQPDKAKAFKLALGYDLSNYKRLIQDIKRHIKSTPAVAKLKDEHGQRYEVVMKLIGPNGKQAKVLTGWIVDAKNGETRMTIVHIDD